MLSHSLRSDTQNDVQLVKREHAIGLNHPLLYKANYILFSGWEALL